MRADPNLLFLRDQIAKGNFGYGHPHPRRERPQRRARWVVRQDLPTGWPTLSDPGVGRVRRPGVPLAGRHALADGPARRPRDGHRRRRHRPLPRLRRVRRGDGSPSTTARSGTLAAGWDDVSSPVTLEICGTEGARDDRAGQALLPQQARPRQRRRQAVDRPPAPPRRSPSSAGSTRWRAGPPCRCRPPARRRSTRSSWARCTTRRRGRRGSR